MDFKRTLTALIGLPTVVLCVALGNQAIMATVIFFIGIICMYEYFNTVSKVSNPIRWVGYLSNSLTLLTIKYDELNKIIVYLIPIIILILFLHIILSDMKYTFKDVSYTFLGIMYIPFFLNFLSLIYKMENGRFLLGYVLCTCWATDIFAYLIGRKYGKHKFSKVSPKKSIEGVIAGIIGAIVISLIFTYFLNIFFKTEYSYFTIIPISLIFSIISQIGDFTASSIKRFAETKDYGNLLPGHGGMLDRIDSLLFLAPFAHLLFLFI